MVFNSIGKALFQKHNFYGVNKKQRSCNRF